MKFPSSVSLEVVYSHATARQMIWPALAAVAVLLLAGCGAQGASGTTNASMNAPTNAPIEATATSADQPVPYQYERTRQLVSLVNDAARLVTKEGRKAFPQLSKRGSRWFHGGLYIFIFNAEGTCVFHPVAPGLVGQSLINLHDFDGKPIVKRVVALTREPGPHPSGWFFYLWEDGTQFEPVWKSSYIRAVVTPDGKHWIVGAGLYNLRVEREFIRERVDEAAKLIKKEGRTKAFRTLLDPSSPFVFLGTYIFVLDMQGKTVVDPAFPTHHGRDLVGFKDAVGKSVVKVILAKMHHTDAAWVQYKWPRPGTHVLGRKVVYVRKVETPEGTLIVGSDTFIASPIWMRG